MFSFRVQKRYFPGINFLVIVANFLESLDERKLAFSVSSVPFVFKNDIFLE